MTNTGLLEATGGGSLVLTEATFTNTGSGTITAGSGSNVTLEGSVTVTGGTLNGDRIVHFPQRYHAQWPDQRREPGRSRITTSTTLEGTITNTGAMQLNSVGNNTFLYPSGAVTLTGGGTLTLSDNNNNYIQEAVGGSSLTNVNNTISGSGNIGNGNMGFTNEVGGRGGRDFSRGHSLVHQLALRRAPPMRACLKLPAAANWSSTARSTNTGGTIEGLAGTGTNAGGSVILINGATITGGTLNTLGTGVNASYHELLWRTPPSAGSPTCGTIALPNNNSRSSLQGTITNNGSIQVNGAATTHSCTSTATRP